MVNETLANGVVQVAQGYFQKIAVGIVIILVGFGLGVLIKKVLYKVFKEIGLNKFASKVGITVNLERWVSSIISYVIYFLTVIVFLDHFLIRSIVLYLIVGAILALLILTFLVGLKDIIPNFIGWLVIQKKGNIKEGRKVEIREIYGDVEKIGYLETEIKTDSGDILYVPNSLFLKNKFKLRRKKD